MRDLSDGGQRRGGRRRLGALSAQHPSGAGGLIVVVVQVEVRAAAIELLGSRPLVGPAALALFLGGAGNGAAHVQEAAKVQEALVVGGDRLGRPVPTGGRPRAGRELLVGHVVVVAEHAVRAAVVLLPLKAVCEGIKLLPGRRQVGGLRERALHPRAALHHPTVSIEALLRLVSGAPQLTRASPL